MAPGVALRMTKSSLSLVEASLSASEALYRTRRRLHETQRLPIDSKRRLNECESAVIEFQRRVIERRASSSRPVTLSRFIGRGHRFQERRLRPRRARSNSERVIFDERARRSSGRHVHDSYAANRHETVRSKQGRTSSKWLLQTIPFIVPMFLSRCPPRWRTSSRTPRAWLTR